MIATELQRAVFEGKKIHGDDVLRTRREGKHKVHLCSEDYVVIWLGTRGNILNPASRLWILHNCLPQAVCTICKQSGESLPSTNGLFLWIAQKAGGQCVIC